METSHQKTVIITGASSGIGRAIAIKLAETDTTIYLVGRSLEKLQQTQALLTSKTTTHCCPLDLADDLALNALTTKVTKETGRLDILVHAAGVLTLGKVEDMPLTEADQTFHTNLRAPYVLTRLCLPLLKKNQGQIVFVNSQSALQGFAGLAAYSISKVGLKMFADVLRAEVNPDGIRVISIYPGRTATPMQEQLYNWEGKSYRPDVLSQPEDVAMAVITALNMAQTTEITDIMLRPMKKG